VQYSVREFISKSAAQLGVTLKFYGEGIDEKAVVSAITGNDSPALKIGAVIVKVDPHYFRPTEVETLLGDPAKAKKKLGWIPEITLDEMIEEMVEHDLENAKQHALLKEHGYVVHVGKEK
jgi:GDPmannose 4,6-dehydratase